MFQPRGPNLRRSCMMAWNQHSEKVSFLYASTCLHSSNCSSVNAEKLPITFALRPLGGSRVILTAFCKTATGNCGLGMAVSQRRKSGCSAEGSKFSTRASILGIHDTARWQFCSRSHMPFLPASSSFRSAMGPCPCPREIESSLSLKPISSAKEIHAMVGSAPELSTKIRGTVAVASLKASGRLNAGGSMYFWSISCVTNAMMPSWILSWRRHLSTSSFWKISSSFSHLPGRGSL
mmetsp:Transcript_66851/g.164804  ORF Transcript_66851/g.164804 Transcript_66851/m.164804 type:complete len:235 (+) Transcript_66851:696-1400(+)